MLPPRPGTRDSSERIGVRSRGTCGSCLVTVALQVLVLTLSSQMAPSQAWANGSDRETPSARHQQAPLRRVPQCIGYRELAILDDSFSLRFERTSPWSPAGSTLLLYGESGLYKVDVTPSGVEDAVLLYESNSIQAFSWSPDGAAIALLAGQAGSRGLRDLIIVVRDGGPVQVLVEREPIWPIEWAADGILYFWDAGSLTPRSASTAHKSEKGTPIAEGSKNRFLPRVDPVKHTTTLGIFDQKNPMKVGVAASLDSLARLGPLLLKDSNSLGRSIVQAASRTFLVDNEGRVIREINVPSDNGQFAASSFCRDDRQILGFFEENDGHTVVSALLVHVDLDTNTYCIVANAGPGWNARVSRNGMYLAYSDPFTGRVHIGVLEAR